jgi:hypothetical protein
MAFLLRSPSGRIALKLLDDTSRTSSVVARAQVNLCRCSVPTFACGGGRARGTQEWIVRGQPYIVVHEIDVARDLVKVVGVTHTACDRG